LLTILLERAGSVVTRDELRELLWPDGEHLDHDHAINRSVNQLREVLRDDPRNPRFIETLPTRGYRFCAEVTVERAEAPMALVNSVAESPARVEVALAVVPQAAALEASAGFTGSVPFFRRYRKVLLVAAAVLIVAGVVGSAAYWRVARQHRESRIVRMGVLPFDAQGEGAAQLSESFRLDLMDNLSQLPNVELPAEHSLDRSAGDFAALQKLANSLQLDVLLMGHFVLDKEGCTLQLEVVRAKDMAHLASFQYNSPKDSLFSIRGRVQRDLFSELQLASAPLHASNGSTEDAEAYNDYLKARDAAALGSGESENQALRLYQAAIDKDPGFARAYSGMAAVHLNLTNTRGYVEHLPLAKYYAEQALKHDPNLAEAHAIMGATVARLDWNLIRAEGELRQAVELEPHSATYRAWLSSTLVSAGKFTEALQQVDRARAEEPLWPAVYSVQAFCAGSARQYNLMIDSAKMYLKLAPTSPHARDLLAWSYYSSGRYKEAIDEWRTMAQQENDSGRVALEDHGWEAFQHGGVKAYAKVRVKAIESGDKVIVRHPNDFVPAEWYAAMGNNDKALANLQALADQHDNNTMFLASNPMLEPLHRDPRFLALLNRLGLTLPVSFPKETHVTQ
jgi:DNA-binding winged helix-turn-helix (wHTH) protein/tetratricopeptide (TPR) repeat protein